MISMSKKISSKKQSANFPVGKFVFILLSIFLFIGAGKTLVQVASASFDKPYSVVLGDTSENQQSSGASKDPVENQVENQNENTGDTQEQQKEQTQEQADQIKEQQKELEIETKDGAKIKVKKEDNNSIKVEMENKSLHFKYETSPEGVQKSVENQNGVPVSVSAKQLQQIQQTVDAQLQQSGVQISTSGAALKVTKDNFSANTVYPISVGGQNGLAVTTPQGEKPINLTPDQVANQLKGTLEVASPSSSTVAPMAIMVKDGQPVYEVTGQKTYKLLNLFNVSQPQTLVVSADTGQVISTQQSFLANIISLFSF